jgi:hypothetical protein
MVTALPYRMTDNCIRCGWCWVNRCWSGIFILFYADSILIWADNTDGEEVRCSCSVLLFEKDDCMDAGGRATHGAVAEGLGEIF